MTAKSSVFDLELVLPDDRISLSAQKLLGFEERYVRVRDQLQLLLQADKLEAWSKREHGKRLAIVDLLQQQYPFAIFYGDVGTGKTAMAEAIGNRLAAESGIEDCMLYKLSNRVRGTGKVGEMGTLISEAFAEIKKSLGKHRRAMLIIDEGDSLGASRDQDQSHHEDKVAVNTLIQAIDDLRSFDGRIAAILCTNRLAALDPAVQRRASIVERFQRPTDAERKQLFEMDLSELNLKPSEVAALVKATGHDGTKPAWTYSDVRTRLYPAAVAAAFPAHPLTCAHLLKAAERLSPSPVMEDR